jgi:uncharacterized OB-fold protein
MPERVVRIDGPRIVRTNPQMLRLEGKICPKGHISLIPRPTCYECSEEKQAKHEKTSTEIVLYKANRTIFSPMEASMSSR